MSTAPTSQPSAVASDSDEQIRAIARRVFDEMFNEKRLEIIPEIYQPDVVFYSPIQEAPIRGHEGVREFVNRIHVGFPDFTTTIKDLVVEGDTAAVRFHVFGTHEGPYLGLPPTGEEINTTQNVFVRVKDGRIHRVWQEINALKKLEQLKVLPPMGGGPFTLLIWAFKTTARIGLYAARFQKSHPDGAEALKRSAVH